MKIIDEDFFLINRLYKSVARQHSLFTQLLPETVQQYSIDYYLLYRIIDTAEDLLQDFDLKKKLLSDVSENFREGIIKTAEALKTKSELIDKNYLELLENIKMVLKFHYCMDEHSKKNIEETGRIMAGGMLKFVIKFEKSKQYQNIDFISDINEFDEYCYYAAGCVGELNTRLFSIAGYYDLSKYDEKIKGDRELGNYLQIVNIIRDNFSDKIIQDKNYFPAVNYNLKKSEQLIKIIEFAANKESRIKSYIESITDKNVRMYCECLFNIAFEHYKFYRERGYDLISNPKIKPPFLKIFFTLPFSLKKNFVKYKLKKYAGFFNNC